MRMWMCLGIACLSLVIACTDLGTDAPPVYFSDAIREAVVRYLFTDNPSGLRQDASAYFLSYCIWDTTMWFWTDQSDPPNEFVDRFKGNIPPVKKGSECSQKGIVLDMKTGKQGLLFVIGNVVVIDQNNMKVYAGYYEGMDSASMGSYYLTRKSGTWTVTRWNLIWIS